MFTKIDLSEYARGWDEAREGKPPTSEGPSYVLGHGACTYALAQANGAMVHSESACGGRPAWRLWVSSTLDATA